MNANLVKYGIIAAGILGGAGLGFGTYKGVKAISRRRAAKKAEKAGAQRQAERSVHAEAPSTMSPVGDIGAAAQAA